MTDSIPSIVHPTQDAYVQQCYNRVAEYRASGKSMRAYCFETGFPLATLSWLNRRTGETLQLSAFAKKKPGKKTEVSLIDQMALSWALAFWKRFPCAPFITIHRELKKACAEQDWKYPSHKTLKRELEKIPDQFKEMMKEGTKGHFERFGLVARREEPSINYRSHVDYSEIPVYAIDMASGQTIKPYISILMDGASRVIKAWAIHKQTPTAEDALLLLRGSILPKKDDRRQFFGLIKELQSDNGAIFTSTDFLHALELLGIDFRPSPPRKPSANGKIERVFSTFQTGLFSHLDAYANRLNALKRAKFALPLPLLVKRVEEFVHEYHNRPHSELEEKTPLEVWTEGLENPYGLEIPVHLLEDAIRVRKAVTVHRDGIEIGGIHFVDPALKPFAGTNTTVLIRVPIDHMPKEVDCFTNTNPPQYLARLKPAEGSDTVSVALSEASKATIEGMGELSKALTRLGDQLLGERKVYQPESNASGPIQTEELRQMPTLNPSKPLGRVPELKPEEHVPRPLSPSEELSQALNPETPEEA